MKESLVRTKSFSFALAIIEQVSLLEETHEYVLSKQLMRSGTSIGANLNEAISAESKKDFLHKYQIALKAARETYYWLQLLNRSKYKGAFDYKRLLDNIEEIIRLLVASTKKLSQELKVL